jgi:DNA-binding transcriptional LysR family regulator
VQFNLLTCTPEEVVDRLNKEEVDLGVISCEPANNLLECQYFFSDHIILIVPESHPWAAKGKVAPQDLLTEPILLREEGSGTRQALLQALAAHDISYEDLNVAMEIGSAEAITASVGAGIGVSFVSRMSAAYALGFECVVEVPVIGLEMRRNIYLLRLSLAAPNRAQEVFCGFIRDSCHDDLYQLAAL